MPLIIKGKLIDEKSPTICVPIVEKNYDDIVAKATRLTVKKVEMVEWRADFFEGLFDREELKRTLQALKSILSDCVFLVTVRSANEGGQVSMEEEEFSELLSFIAKTHCADLIDLEYFQYTNPAAIIKEIQNAGTGVIASHHDFEKTPSKGVNLRLLEEMEKADPDVIKLCVMPGSKKDVFELASASAEFSATRQGLPLIIIAMGDLGVITRTNPGAFSSCVSFGAVDKTSAPGQVEFTKLKELIEFSKNYY